MKKLIYILIVVNSFFLVACSTIRLENYTQCNLDEHQLKIKIKDIDKKIKDVVIRYSIPDTLVNKNCEGFYYIEVLNWKNVKNKYNYVSIPLIIIDNNFYVNKYFFNNQELLNDKIDKEFIIIQNQLESKFDKNSIDKMKVRFNKGITKTSSVKFL